MDLSDCVGREIQFCVWVRWGGTYVVDNVMGEVEIGRIGLGGPHCGSEKALGGSACRLLKHAAGGCLDGVSEGMGGLSGTRVEVDVDA